MSFVESDGYNTLHQQQHIPCLHLICCTQATWPRLYNSAQYSIIAFRAAHVMLLTVNNHTDILRRPVILYEPQAFPTINARLHSCRSKFPGVRAQAQQMAVRLAELGPECEVELEVCPASAMSA